MNKISFKRLLSLFLIVVILSMSIVVYAVDNDEHNQLLSYFDGEVAELICVDCGAVENIRFDSYINGYEENLDVVNDGIINAKDYAVLRKRFSVHYELASPDDFSITKAGSGASALYKLDKYIGSKENIIVPPQMTINGVTRPVAFWSGVFANNEAIKNVYIDDVSVISGTISKIFQNAVNLKCVKGQFLPSKVQAIKTAQYLFEGCINLESVELDMSNWTGLTSDQNHQFYNCKSLKRISGPIAVVKSTLNSMFYGCSNLDEIYLNSSQTNGINLPYDVKKHFVIYAPANTTAFRQLTMLASDATYYNKFDIVPIGADNSSYVWCVGDSITEATGFVNRLYDVYAKNPNNSTIPLNIGIMGDTTYQMAYRTGTYKMLINESFTIPAEAGDSVDIKIVGEKGGYLPRLFPNVSINGVRGTITRSGSKEPYTYTFSRYENGEEIYVDVDTAISVETDISNISPDDTLIINAGTNDLQSNDDLINDEKINARVISIIQDMIDYSGTDNYVVCGITTADRYDDSTGACSHYENMMSNAFGDHFVNSRSYFLSNAYDITGLVATDADNEAMSRGQVPTVFKSDKLHLNDYGATVLANCVYDFLNK